MVGKKASSRECLRELDFAGPEEIIHRGCISLLSKAA